MSSLSGDSLSCKDIGSRLITARSARGLSQNRLAQLAGLSQQTVRRLELGACFPAVDTVERIAQVLGVSPAWLAWGVIEMPMSIINADTDELTVIFLYQLKTYRLLWKLGRRGMIAVHVLQRYSTVPSCWEDVLYAPCDDDGNIDINQEEQASTRELLEAAKRAQSIALGAPPGI